MSIDDDGQSTSFYKDVEVTLDDGREVILTVHLECIQFSEPPSGTNGPPEFYDPGGAAEFQFSAAQIDGVKISEDDFWALGDKAQLAYDSAVESAQDSGEF